MQRYVKTDYGKSKHFTAGKVYNFGEFNGEDEFLYNTKDDDGTPALIVPPDSNLRCAHLDFKGTWQWCDKDGNTLEDT